MKNNEVILVMIVALSSVFIFILVFGIIFIGFYFYFFSSFLEFHGWWIVLCFGYVVYSLWGDNLQKLKWVEDNVKFVEAKDRRIDFWN